MKSILHNARGFTLIEMLMALAAGLVVSIAIYSAYQNHQRSHVTQQLVVDMQQNARAAMALMKREIRMMGYDPAATDGIDNNGDTNIDCADPLNTDPDEVCDDAGESANDNPLGVPIGIVDAQPDRIQFTADYSYNDPLTDLNNYTPDLSGANENLTYALVGTTLQRNGQPVAYDIEAIGFAYAVDNEPTADGGDGELDTDGGAIIWATDSNLGDDSLDKTLDSNNDGIIDENDPEGGANLATPIPNSSIRAVRIWLLARTRQPIKDHTDNNTYVVGPIHRGPADGDWDPSRKRVLLTTTIYCRNMGS
ncbi:MAG: PilW family protein [Desulfobacterales bacterium]